MAGKFFSRDAIIDTRRNLDRMNAIRKRQGPVRYHTHLITCFCPDPTCGAYSSVDETRPLPTPRQAEQTLLAHRHQRKARRKRFNRARLERLRAGAASGCYTGPALI
ncbi:hypothetical protein CFR75_06505 [Komagataeibacter xylinus]|uniref:Uncharacterized protein n=1 Tax=Komagataeibacter xylinus TaxID=28448 RepID=A0A318PPA6_KOMXY|nr:hypothetical protein [Komagataeibacter xylinus]AZV38144.1 hypothetical protein CXP35_04290 [Komagataeibacter xylinus]PYD57460.1 hypothetical protein CFR75_06505 [Komagataeibacter xylinus]GBQ80988.1 hypothetical protein AA15237_3122 [Komagataeibacter xylinus NBRC 15237]